MPLSPLFSNLTFGQPPADSSFNFGSFKSFTTENKENGTKKELFPKESPLSKNQELLLESQKVNETTAVGGTTISEKEDYSKTLKQFPPHFLYFTKDTFPEPLKKPKNNTIPDDMDSRVTEQDQQWRESYEKMTIKGVSKSFKQFQKAVERYPNQCIR
jgi:hypothetical protein